MAYSIERMPERISIGRETETGVTDVMIDCGAWVSKWPGMTLHAIHTPEGGAPYILQTETDGGVLVWHVTDADTATPGTGRMEIVGEMDGRRKVSATVKVSVAARMSGTVGEPPEAAKPWVESVIGAADRITGMKAQAKTLDAGSGATAAWDGEQGLLTIGVPKGKDGKDGADGKDAVVDTTLTQSGQAADAKATGDAIGQLKGDMTAKADKAALTRTDRSLDALWKLNQGISYNFETDAAAAYAKQVPSGAKFADVNSIGGHTEAIDGELVSADVESVKYNDAIIADIPSTVRALPGYGWSAGSVYNSIERTESGWKYVQRVGSVDLGSLNWNKRASENGASFFETIVGSINGMKVYSNMEKWNSLIMPKYNLDIAYKIYRGTSENLSYAGWDGRGIRVRDDAYTDAQTFKSALAGVMLYYELAETIITDITEAMLDTLEPFDVEGGGAITFENNAKLPVPSSVEYLVSLAEVGV